MVNNFFLQYVAANIKQSLMAQVHAGFPTPGIELGMTTVLFFLIVIYPALL